MKHTICRKVRKFKEQNTILVSHLYRLLKPSKLNNVVVLLLKIISLNYIGYALLISISASITTIYNLKRTNGIVFRYLKKVKIFVSSYNPQITKARVNNLNLHKSNITLNSGLSMRVGISEAIRMLFSSSLNLLFILVLSSQWHNGTMAQWHNGTMAQWLQIIKKFLILFSPAPSPYGPIRTRTDPYGYGPVRTRTGGGALASFIYSNIRIKKRRLYSNYKFRKSYAFEN